MPVIRTVGLTHVYNQGSPFEKAAVNDINIEIEKGDFIGVIGHTGSGKSTLIQHFNGLLKPTSGKIFIDEEDLWADKARLRQCRFKVGLVFQYPEYQLFEETVAKDIAFGPRNMGLSEEEIKQRVAEAAEFVGLKEKHLERSPFDLSGGQKRRAAIAGVIAMRPEVLILDEPTAGLDPKGREKILTQIRNYHKVTGNTVLLVSHSMEDIARYADKVLVLADAQIKFFDTVDNVFSHAQELTGLGLEVPQITKVFLGLAERGYPVRRNIYTVEDGKNEILRLKAELNKGGVQHA
ncbi:energy-coupling factor transporter ATPase [Acetanaerobacterium elongatum]|uniref:Energy-coupling factor transporter ATP-binding protein EcfA2 n=1 Tax=Acetanaerobacterium elongatum TaxID=258515 RepID=A0A1G9V8H9_9FIRM|nr:energy-coupling factor transporter ATPase [Acetanaerobacterium elongatum]SDM68461.1 energy-coupling factor transport system ATP-binding protein [Acetanaerobacterium elongatum]